MAWIRSRVSLTSAVVAEASPPHSPPCTWICAAETWSTVPIPPYQVSAAHIQVHGGLCGRISLRNYS
eukprot:1063495-Pyramimonas_sp.AAC.1